jgi:hypothetical protein
MTGALIEQYRQIHRTKRYSHGGCVQRYVNDITHLCCAIPTRTILDYGCGKGLQYTEDKIHEPWGVMPCLFDPGVPGIDELPDRTFDGVICTGVLEHIPEDEIVVALDNLTRYAKRWAFIVVGIRPTKKLLPDGRQAHVTLRPKEWWCERIKASFDPKVVVRLEFE